MQGLEAEADAMNAKGWFDGLPDLTYFPVNRTGIDPVLNVPQPAKLFTKMYRSDGVSFQLVDSYENPDRCALVLDHPKAELSQSRSLKIGSNLSLLWMLGAASQASESGVPIARVKFQYTNGESREVPIRFGMEVGAFQAPTALTRGRQSWSGISRSVGGGNSDIYLYAWPVNNPRVDWKVESIGFLSGDTEAALGVVGVSAWCVD